MDKRRQTLFIMLICMLFFATACSDTTGTHSAEENNDSTGEFESSEEVVLMEQPVVSLQNMEQGVLVTWNAIPNAEGYIVYSKPKDGKFNNIATIKDSSTVEYLDLNAPAGTEYYYTVRAYSGEQKSDYKGVSITTGIWQPEVKVVYAQSKMKISWNQITGVDGYYVYKKEEGGKYSRLATIKDFLYR